MAFLLTSLAAESAGICVYMRVHKELFSLLPFIVDPCMRCAVLVGVFLRMLLGGEDGGLIGLNNVHVLQSTINRRFYFILHDLLFAYLWRGRTNAVDMNTMNGIE